MTSLYTALVLHVIGFLGLILVANDVANRGRETRNEIVGGSLGNSEIEQSGLDNGVENEAVIT